jgi:hypothetical protein
LFYFPAFAVAALLRDDDDDGEDNPSIDDAADSVARMSIAFV